MPKDQRTVSPEHFSTFGDLLRYLRERAHLSQRELAALVGYHFSYISYLEKNTRAVDEASLLGRFVPALGLEDDLEWAKRLLELSKVKNGDMPLSVRSAESTVGETKADGLPPSLTSMIGREVESARLRKMILNPDIRLVSVLGPPGVGKTCLSLNVARALQPAFQDGVLFVDLAVVSDPQYLLPAIAAALGIAGSAAVSAEEALKPALAEKNLLIVLDNFEQVVSAAPLLLPLLGAAPRIKTLVTSREVLRLRGEHEFHLDPLPIPPRDGLPIDSNLMDFSSVALFVARARAARPEFHVDEKNASFAAEICSRLDGLPLAIELAAARIRTMSLASMIEQFDRRFDWLSQGARDQPEWRQTLTGAIEWSVNLLTEQERALFHRLSIFPGGWTLAAAEEICSDDVLCGRSEVFRLLIHLMEKSLVIPEDEDGRFSFLATIREFAFAGLGKSGELETLRKRHFEYYLRFMQAAKPNIRQGAHQLLWLDRTEREYPNLRLALEWAVEKTERASQAMELGFCVHGFWVTRSYIRDARQWLSKILALDPSPNRIRADLLRFASDYASSQGEYAQAQTFEEEAMNISRALADEPGIYFSMDGMAMLSGAQGNYERASGLLEEVLVYRRRQNDAVLLAATLNNLAIATRRLGNLESAKGLFLEAVRINREKKNMKSLSHSLHGLAEIDTQQGNYENALALFKESIEVRVQLLDMKGLAYSLDSLAMLAELMGYEYIAVKLKGASDQIREKIGSPVTLATEREQKEFLNRLKSKLGGEKFETAWFDGQTMSLEQTLEVVGQLRGLGN